MRLNESEKFEQLTRQITKADVLSANETEKILTAPHLLGAIRARVEAEKSLASAPTKIGWAGWLGKLFPTENRFVREKMWRPVTIGAFIVLFVASSWYLGKPLLFQNGENRLAQSQPSGNNELDVFQIDKELERESRPQPDQSKIKEIPAGFSNSPLLPGGRSFRPKKNYATAQRPKNFKKINRQKPVQTREFHQLAYASDLEANENKQIVRVNLSPTALARLGVTSASVPARQSDSYTADLLLGEDGSPRAIRFVK